VTPSEAKAVLETAFKSGWGNTTPIAWGNTTPPMPDSHWVRFTIIHAESRLRSWTGNIGNYQRRGFCFIQIFVPLGSGTRMASDLSLMVMNILEGKTFGILTTEAASMLEVGQGDDAKDQTQVRIPFAYDDQRSL
jgi:hypothetical protein